MPEREELKSSSMRNIGMWFKFFLKIISFTDNSKQLVPTCN